MVDAISAAGSMAANDQRPTAPVARSSINHVVSAALEKQRAFRREDPQIAGMAPAVAERLGRGLRIVNVARAKLLPRTRTSPTSPGGSVCPRSSTIWMSTPS
jgi:hypothetical protein